MLLLISILLAFFVVPEAWRVPVVIGGAILEFVETSATIWISRRSRVRVGPEALIGSIATVVEDCAPNGAVRIRGEVWRARCDGVARAGDRVRVVERRGLRLTVSRASEPLPSPPQSAESRPPPSDPRPSG